MMCYHLHLMESLWLRKIITCELCRKDPVPESLLLNPFWMQLYFKS
jgi:hypothetical protein